MIEDGGFHGARGATEPGRIVHGVYAAGFDSVAAAFAKNLQTGRELGAACAIWVDGAPVLELWGGVARPSDGTLWDRGTIVPVFSVSKGVAAVCALSLADRGLFALDEPLAKYWPEFVAHGKGRITIREAMGHRAGVPYVDGEVTLQDLADPVGMAARIAEQPPSFEPGAAYFYHAWTVGWIVNELVRRTVGCSVGHWLRENVATPLGLDLWMGLPETEREKVATLSFAGAPDAVALPPGSVPWRAVSLNGAVSVVPGGSGVDLNDARLQAMELPAGGVLTSANALAKLYAACLTGVDGVRLLSDSIIEDGSRTVSSGLAWGSDVDGGAWGAGVMRPWSNQPMLGPRCFGHDGFGGSLAFADPATGVSFAYVRNQLSVSLSKDAAVYDVVDALAAKLGVKPASR